MMRLHHVAIWVSDLDGAAAFWTDYFGASISELYESRRQKGFRSRFARLGDDLQIELMSKPGLSAAGEHIGWAHIALSVGGETAVDRVATQFARDGRLLRCRHAGRRLGLGSDRSARYQGLQHEPSEHSREPDTP